MKKPRKTMLQETKMPKIASRAKSQPFRVHQKGVDGHKGAIRDAGIDTVVPKMAKPSPSRGGAGAPKPEKQPSGMPKAPRKGRLPHSVIEHHPKAIGDIAMLKRTPFR